jgi:hypothetical protein
VKYTNEQIRAAFLRAADRIERNPKLYDFGKMSSPDDEGGCGCMWGHVGLGLGMTSTLNVDIATACGMVPPGPSRMATGVLYDFASGEAITSAIEAAKCLRAFADHKFPASVPKLEPSYLAFRSKLLRESVSA